MDKFIEVEVTLLLLERKTIIRMLELYDEIIITDKLNVNGNKCVHISNAGLPCPNHSSKDQNGWLCRHHHQFIANQIAGSYLVH